MAATITQTNYKGDKFTVNKTPDVVIGTGAPANTDVLATQVKKYPIGTFYLDTAAPKLWIRKAVAGTAADFVGVVVA